jgi:hypothetical protein
MWLLIIKTKTVSAVSADVHVFDSWINLYSDMSSSRSKIDKELFAVTANDLDLLLSWI